MALVRLKNYKVVDEAVLKNKMAALKSLWRGNVPGYGGLDGQVAVIELYEKALDPSHELWGNTANVLKDMGMLDDCGRIDTATKNIILCAIEGRGTNITLVSPLAPDRSSSVNLRGEDVILTIIQSKVLKDLWEGNITGYEGLDGQVAIAELYEKAQNPSHKFFEDKIEAGLQNLGLLDSNGDINHITRELICSSVKKQGYGITLELPSADGMPECGLAR